VRPLTLAIVLLLAGCTTADAIQRTSPHPRSPAPDATAARSRPSAVSPAPGRLLIFFKRAVGADPTASQLTVDRNGQASALETNGGPGGEHRENFRLAPNKLRRLETLVRTTSLHDTDCCNPNYYTYFVSNGKQSWRLDQTHVPARARALIADLDAITDAHTVYTGPSG
jgi:hypothetical protein